MSDAAREVASRPPPLPRQGVGPRARLAALLLFLPALAAAQQPDTTRRELDSLRAEVARLQAAVEQLGSERSNGTRPSGDSGLPANARERQPPSALNTPSRLPHAADEYRKAPPRFDVLLQVRGDYIADEPEVATFFFQKVELGIKGQVAEDIAFSVELDPVRPDDPFRRTYIRLGYLEHLLLKVGLEKAPVGLAELTSSDELPFVSRPEVSNRFAPAEELGVHLEAPWEHWLVQLSVTNGNGRAARDDNERKDVSARVVWGPLPWLSVGASANQGAIGEVPRDRDRYNVEVRLGDDLSGLQAEGYRAKDASVWSTAAYVEAYRAIPVRADWLAHVQPAIRYERIDRNDDVAVEELSGLTVGLNLLFHGHSAKLQLNYLSDLRSQGRASEYRALYQVAF